MRPAFAVLTATLLAVLVVAAPVPKDKAKEEPATDEQRKEVEDRLKEIVLGMHNYHDAVGSMPADVVDAKKKPLLSWRVQLLPYMEYDELYKEFKLDEAWDSDTNKKLIEKLPKVYAPTRVKAEKGETFYRGFGGTNAITAGLFETGKKVGINSITDGTSNTIAVIDAGEPVIWTKPGTDLDPDAKEFPKLGRMIDGDFFYCAMCDGSTKKVLRKFDEKAIKAAISRNGGEVYSDDGLFAK
jgi:Protein of unknown function (DUF1559)